MVNEFCGFRKGVIGKDKLPSDTTLNNMKKADLIKLLHTAQHNYESLMWFYNNAVKWNMEQLNNNGWIPCSERLPSEDGFYNVTVKFWYLNKPTVISSHFECGKWTCVALDTEDEVIAWQPLPQPYVKGE